MSQSDQEMLGGNFVQGPDIDVPGPEQASLPEDGDILDPALLEPPTQAAPAQEFAAPAPVDPVSNFNTLINEMRTQLPNQQTQGQYNQPQQQPPAWVDPFDRPEIAAERVRLYSEASYNEEAVARLSQIDRAASDERMSRQMDLMRQQISTEMQAPALSQQAFVQAQQAYPEHLRAGLRQQDWDGAVQDLFGDNRQMVAQLLDPRNPQSANTRQHLADLAYMRAYRSGAIAPQPAARPAPPVQVRSDARAPSLGTPPPQNAWEDPAWVNGVMQDAFFTPNKFVKKGGNQ